MTDQLRVGIVGANAESKRWMFQDYLELVREPDIDLDSVPTRDKN